MTNQELFSYVDHTLLKPEATPEQIAVLCAEAAEHGTASVASTAAMCRWPRSCWTARPRSVL